MNIQEQGFRSSLFGFDKNDVLAYMNALANEAQQHELEYNRQLQQLQSKLDELRSERSTADSRMDALKAELAAATQRADTAEAKRREADEQLETIKKKTASFQSTQRESQKNANIWQLKCHDLQQQVDELQKQLTAARALNTAAAPAAPEEPHGGECPQHCVGRHAGAGASGPRGRAPERRHAGFRRPDAGHLSGA